MEGLANGTAATPATETPSSRLEQFTFTGSGGEYFRIWIVNMLLSILTLGIYSAWAKVRRLRYFYGNTHLAGSVFEYHGQPIQILKGRLLAVGVLILSSWMTTIWPLTNILFTIVFLIGTPWIVVKARTFRNRMSSYRNIRFNFAQSYGEATAVYVGFALLIPLTLGLLLPYWMYRHYRFNIANSSYGTTRFGFLATPGTIYKVYVKVALVTIPLFVLFFALLFQLGKVGTISDNPGPVNPFEIYRRMVWLLALLPLYLVVVAYAQKSLGNASLGNATLGPNRVHSNLQTWPLWRIYMVNTILIVLTLGLYYPWAQVNLMRYRLQSLAVELHGSLDQFVADQQAQVAAAGDELASMFDIDLGL